MDIGDLKQIFLPTKQSWLLVHTARSDPILSHIITTQKNLKTNTETLIFSIWTRLQGSQGCQKMCQDPLNTPFEVWCPKIAPKSDLPQIDEFLKTSKKTGFFDNSFSILMIFRSWCLSGAILGQELNSLICKKIFDCRNDTVKH